MNNASCNGYPSTMLQIRAGTDLLSIYIGLHKAKHNDVKTFFCKAGYVGGRAAPWVDRLFWRSTHGQIYAKRGTG
jgi:hypothetical protein